MSMIEAGPNLPKVRLKPVPPYAVKLRQPILGVNPK